MADINISPLNDLSIIVILKGVDPATGKAIQLTTGTVTHFIATSNTPTATAADAALSGVATHVGSGKWLISYDAAVLTAALLDTLFASVTPYLIIQQPNEFRVYVPLVYLASRSGTVA